MTERTFVLIKPDAVQRGLIGEITGRLERTGLQIVGMKMIQIGDDLARRHYAEHQGKPFFEGLVSFIKSSPVVAMCLEGPSAIAIVRKTMGATAPADSAPGTIRGDFGVDIGRNLIHGSANEVDAKRETSLFFSASELATFDRAIQKWITE